MKSQKPAISSEIENEKIEVSEVLATEIPLSPAVRKLIADLKIDPNTISGTGKDGRITKSDVLNSQKKAVVDLKPNLEPSISSPTVKLLESESRFTRRPLSPIRRKIASRLVEAQQTVAILSTFNEVDLSEVMLLRKHQELFVKKTVLNWFTSFFKAVVHARAVPQINSRLEGDELIENHYYDIGVVGTERFSCTCFKDCDLLSFADIENQL